MLRPIIDFRGDVEGSEERKPSGVFVASESRAIGGTCSEMMTIAMGMAMCVQ